MLTERSEKRNSKSIFKLERTLDEDGSGDGEEASKADDSKEDDGSDQDGEAGSAEGSGAEESKNEEPEVDEEKEESAGEEEEAEDAKFDAADIKKGLKGFFEKSIGYLNESADGIFRDHN
jgi:hypothetical protein